MRTVEFTAYPLQKSRNKARMSASKSSAVRLRRTYTALSCRSRRTNLIRRHRKTVCSSTSPSIPTQKFTILHRLSIVPAQPSNVSFQNLKPLANSRGKVRCAAAVGWCCRRLSDKLPCARTFRGTSNQAACGRCRNERPARHFVTFFPLSDACSPSAFFV